MAKPGILYVTIDHDASLPRVEFEDWYNNEHGPLRVNLPFVQNGRRYRATDGDADGTLAPWMAVYDVDDLEQLRSEAYMQLWKTQSQREKDVLARCKSTRYFYEEELGSGSVNDSDRVPAFIMTLRMYLPKDASAEQKKAMADDVHRWYVDEHVPLLEKIPGWLRSRRFVLSPSFHAGEDPHWFAIHEYSAADGNGGPEFRYATSTVWRQRIMADTTQDRRNYVLHYDFGRFPRDLAALNVLPPRAVIERPFEFADGTASTYRLEGSTDPDAPVLVLVDGLMTSRAIWDDFVKLWTGFFHPHFRVLRYENRGRGPLADGASGDKMTAEVLADDLAFLLDALKMPRVDTIMGVSLGGVTALRFALKYPQRLDRLVVCDCPVQAPASAAAAWEGRRKRIRELGMASLSAPTTRRWFLPPNLDSQGARDVADMIASNDVEGFCRSSDALIDFNMLDQVPNLRCRTLFLSGEADGLLPVALKAAAAKLPEGKGHGGYAEVQLAGHLPMVENCMEFVKQVNNFMA